MNSTHEDAVLNFDLDFLHPPTNNIPVPAPKHKYITQLKRRIIRVDALQNHSNAINQELNNKNKELEEVKRKLETTTQEYTQTSLDYKEALESSARCEMENVKLKAIIKRLEEDRFKAVNDYEAIKSHVTQLEQLVKQQERKLESQDKIDKKKTDKLIEERISAKAKENEKEILLWKKKYETLQKQFQDLKCSYNKLNEEVSKAKEQKKVFNEVTEVSMSPDLSDNEDDMSVDVTLSVDHKDLSQTNANKTKKLHKAVHTSMEFDNDCINEVVCADLGYGSSLASSDNEKGLNSPDFVFSPINADNSEIHRTRKLVTTATSPLQLLKTVEIATSPILSIQMIDVAVSPQNIIDEPPDDIECQHLPIIPDDRATSQSISNISPVTNDNTEIVATPVKKLKSVSPIKIEINTNDIKEAESKTDESLGNVPIIEITQEKLYSKTIETSKSLPDIDMSQEQQCLELNNSNNMREDYSADNEIEMILNKMRFNHKLITPIPRTPGKSSRRSDNNDGYLPQGPVDEIHSPCVDAAIARAQAASAREDAASAREDAAKTREDNSKLMTTLNHLMKEMFTIKSFLKSQMAMPDISVEPNQNNLLSNAPLHKVTSANKSRIDSIDEINSARTSQPIHIWAPDKKITVISEEIIKPADTGICTTRGTLLNKIQSIEQEKSYQQHMQCTEMEISASSNCEKVETNSPTKDVMDKKGKKCKKLTNLAKYRKKCELPKYKIKRETPPLVKPIKKPKQLRLIKQVSEQDTAATLNDTQVYAKAVKVMAELNAKTKGKDCREGKPNTQRSQGEENDGKDKNDNIYQPSAASNCGLLKSATISQPLIVSERLKSPLFAKEPVVVIRRCSTENLILSPKSAALSRKLSIKSPELSTTTCDNSATLKSPEPTSASLKPLLTPSSKNVTSQEITDQSAKLKGTPRTRSYRSPVPFSTDDFTSPMRSLKSPETQSPSKSTKTSPNLSIKSPELISPRKHRMTSPNRSINHPEMNSPTKFAITSPDRSIKSIEMNSPTLSTITATKTSETPVKLIESNVASFKQTGPLSPLRRSPRSPEVPIVSKERAKILSNLFDESPEKTVLRPHCSITSPKAAFTFPNRSMNAESLSRLTANTFPRQDVNSSDLPISSSNCNETALTPFKSSETVLKSPKLAVTTRSSSSAVSDITSPKLPNLSANLTVSSPTSSRITRSQTKHENTLIEVCSVGVTRDVKVQQAALNTEKNPPMKRKRTLSNGSDLQNRKTSRRIQSINEKENTTGINENAENTNTKSLKISTTPKGPSWDVKESVLCVMIEKYGLKTMKPNSRSVPGAVLNKISDLIDKNISKIKDSAGHETAIMNELVMAFEEYDYKVFVSGLINFLVNPDRKLELFGKTSMLAAPSMTKVEQVLLYVLRQLRHYWSPVDMVEFVLSAIENTLFKLNRTPEFNIIESVSHFYALVCRYFALKSRLIVYMLDAMYCIQFKAVPLIKQCLDVWPHVIPLAHMSLAKNTLVTCFVYLLHFYKCEDKFSRVQEIRIMLYRKYFYQFTDWNERKILEIFQSAITDLRDIPFEKKMLRVALIILGKRHGPRWTQNNIIKKILQPLIENEKVSNSIKAFCISMIGPLMKPFPADMKANCEFAMNQLVDIKNAANSKEIEEAAISSLVIMNRHNNNRVIELLLKEKMRPLSPDLEDLICHLIRTKPIHVWLKTLSRMPLFDND